MNLTATQRVILKVVIRLGTGKSSDTSWLHKKKMWNIVVGGVIVCDTINM